jgi:hypothetical protein
MKIESNYKLHRIKSPLGSRAVKFYFSPHPKSLPKSGRDYESCSKLPDIYRGLPHFRGKVGMGVKRFKFAENYYINPELTPLPRGDLSPILFYLVHFRIHIISFHLSYR